MVPDPTNRSDLGRYLAMGQIGTEMVAPIGLGILLDYWFGWLPWCTVAGACIGLVAGLFLLVRMANKEAKGRAEHKSESS